MTSDWTSTDQASNPNPTQTADLLAEALLANRESGRLAAYLLLVAALLLLVFTGRLASYLRQQGEEGEWMSFTVLAAWRSVGRSGAGGRWIRLRGHELTTFEPDPAVAKVVFLWGWNSAFLYSAPLTAIAIGTTATAVSRGLFPRWTRWLSSALVVLMLVGFLLGVPGMATIVGLLWLTTMSILLTFTGLFREATTPQARIRMTTDLPSQTKQTMTMSYVQPLRGERHRDILILAAHGSLPFHAVNRHWLGRRVLEG